MSRATLNRPQPALGRVSAMLILAGMLLAIMPSAAVADTDLQVAQALRVQDAYITDTALPNGHIRPGDLARLKVQAQRSADQGVPEKLVIVGHYDPRYANTYAAARALRHFIDFSGVLVMVSPHGLGVSSDKLNLNELQAIEQKARPDCLTSYTDCAVLAGAEATSRVKADEASSQRNAAIFWVVILVILGAVIAFLVWNVQRQRNKISGRLDDLRRAASNTLSLADSAVNDIEREIAGSPNRMPTTVRNEYDRALALRDQARNELDRAASSEMLTQVNQDAAQAVLALQGVMRSLGIQNPLANPLEAQAGHRCFYCGRDDRPPYTQRTIEDGRGNSMQVEVCSVCSADLARGQQPQVATVNYQGTRVPWWAVPNDPWYYSYGGPSWQNWLPFFAGLEVGQFFGGGWGGGWGGPVIVNEGGWGDSGWGGGDAPSVSGDTVDPYTDQGAGDFGSWGGDSSGGGGDWGGDSGGWGDSGGGDWGGDSGGGDWGSGGDGW